MKNKTKEPQDSKGKNWTWTMWQEEINWSKIEKSIQIKTVAGLITVEKFELANPVI